MEERNILNKHSRIHRGGIIRRNDIIFFGGGLRYTASQETSQHQC
jgi:hypothetical protein